MKGLRSHGAARPAWFRWVVIVLAWFVPLGIAAFLWIVGTSAETHFDRRPDAAGARAMKRYIGVALVVAPMVGVVWMLALRGRVQRRVAIVLFVVIGIGTSAVCAVVWEEIRFQVRCGGQRVGAVQLMLHLYLAQMAYAHGDAEFPWSLAEFCYRDHRARALLTDWCWRDWTRANRVGPWSLEEIGQNAMPLDQLLAVIGESDASRWERMGPVVMCLRASQIEREAYPASMSGVIVGWTMWEEQGMAGIWAVFNGGSVSAIAGKDLRDEAERSIAFNESIGIPMPEEIVEELRGAMGGR